MYQYSINHVVILDYAKRVRDAHAVSNRYNNDPDLFADVIKCHARLDAIANILRLRPGQLWSIVRALERAGYGFESETAHPRYYRDSARLFNRAFENAKK